MKLTVENFGPIREARNIVVNPMTIFVGPSNTGKSYLAILVYAIVKGIGRKNPSFFESPFSEWSIWKKLDRMVDAVWDEKGNPAYPYELKPKIESKVRWILDEMFISWAKETSHEIRGQILRCFGEEGKRIMENGKNLKIEIGGRNEDILLDVLAMERSRLSPRKKSRLTKELEDTIREKLKRGQDQAVYHQDIWSSRKEVKNLLLEIYERKFRFGNGFISLLLAREGSSLEPHYLPAVRGGIMQSHRTLVNALIDRAPMAGLSDRFSPIPLFSGVLSDFMSKLVNVTAPPQRQLFRADRREKIQTIGKEMEVRIMGGKIEIQQSETHYPDFHYQFNKGREIQDLPLMSASSMVSELAPVSLFLHHYVLPGDLFVLEEPEAHLHPAAQRTISNILVRLADCGVHVIVTTHSDYILEQVGNYACAATVGEAIDGRALEAEKISVYLFDQSEGGDVGGTVVKPVPLDKETGFVTQDHLDVSSALYNETVGLMEKRETDAN